MLHNDKLNIAFVLQEKISNGHGCGQVVRVVTFYSDGPSLNPAEVDNFYVKLLWKRTKMNKKRLSFAH